MSDHARTIEEPTNHWLRDSYKTTYRYSRYGYEFGVCNMRDSANTYALAAFGPDLGEYYQLYYRRDGQEVALRCPDVSYTDTFKTIPPHVLAELYLLLEQAAEEEKEP